MKTFITAALLTATILSAPAMAFGVPTNNLIPNLLFPEPVQEPVTRGQVNSSK
ncbi:hypothetical protein [Ruegeria atlantica]|uniref:hypothetical protein n=1 Tax=Ruegeria atlantica TaxID=81569 RepID=UPI00147E1C54|nr:hypothetical protein [Ruegeria atlantica]